MNLSDDDPIWDAIYDQDDFVHLDRSETDPIMRVVVAELRRLASHIGPQVGVVDGSDGMTRGACAAALHVRADELTRAVSPSPLPGGEEK